MNKRTMVYVHLLEEGTPTSRGTEAIPLGNNIYKLLATEDYDPNDEVWQFLPGSIVRCEQSTTADNEPILLAIEQIG